MATITKAELCGRVAMDCGMPEKEIAPCVDALIDLIREGVNHDGSVMLTNFGVLEKRVKRERRGRNMQTGEAIAIAPRNVVVFRVSRNFREGLNAE